jgi:hypothetical protein
MRKKLPKLQEIVRRLFRASLLSIAIIFEVSGVSKAAFYTWLASDKRLIHLFGSKQQLRTRFLAMTWDLKPNSRIFCPMNGVNLSASII